MISPTRSSGVRSIVLALVLALVAAVPVAVWADPTGPAASDRQVALAVTWLLRRDHLLRRPLDDEISRRCLKLYLKALDPAKLYFYQADVDRFRQRENDLDDLAKKGNVDFAFEVFQTFLQRVDERVQMVDQLLAMRHDFTVDEQMLVDREQAAYPSTPAEAFELWRKRIKYDLLVLKVDGIEGQAAIEKLRNRYHSFARRMHQTDSEELLEMYLSSLTSAFDPHTSYMSPSTLENFEIQMRLELEGIGAALRAEDSYVVVQKIIPGGAADRQGELQVDDKIVGVGQGEDGEIVDTVDMKLTDVVKLIRGTPGTVVRLEIISAKNQQRKIITITRAKIELKDSEAQAKVFEVPGRPGGGSYRIGVIDLPSFYMDMEGARRGLPDFRSTTRDVARILEQFNQQQVDAVVLDLRRNGGGSLTEAINLTGLFIPDGPVVQVKDADGNVRPYADLDPAMVWKGPLVVLTSKFSASASEILAGAIQDYGRGLIVGDPATHGKGTVQSLMDIGQQLFQIPNATSLGALKITMQQFYRPSGDSTQKRGVLADIELPSLTAHMDVAEADLDYVIDFDRVEPANYQRLGHVDTALRQELRRRSAQRIAQSEEFQKLLRNIARYEQQKAKDFVTLNEEKFLQERAELNADKEEEKTFEEFNGTNEERIERDYYLDEAFAITVDYLNLRQVAQAN